MFRDSARQRGHILTKREHARLLFGAIVLVMFAASCGSTVPLGAGTTSTSNQSTGGLPGSSNPNSSLATPSGAGTGSPTNDGLGGGGSGGSGGTIGSNVGSGTSPGSPIKANAAIEVGYKSPNANAGTEFAVFGYKGS